MSVPIRGLRADDRPALEAVLRSDESFTAAEIAVALELIDDALENPEATDYWFRLAEIDGVVAGYICYGPTPMTASTFDLYWIVCRTRFRGRGVASALIRAMEADLADRGGTAVRVETSVKEGHAAARRLYDRLGYPEAARFPDFYEPGDDLIVYFKQLSRGGETGA